MNRISAAVVSVSLLVIARLNGQDDAKFAADNLKFSREFYAKVHFVTVSTLPTPFKYDRYPGNGPERFQTDDGTYLRQHGRAWKHVAQPMRSGLPINYAENDRYVMSFAGKDQWGKFGDEVDKETAGKLDQWVRLIDAAINFDPGPAVKLVDKFEANGRAQWVIEAPSSNGGTPTRLTFRKPVSDKTANVLLHEVSGSWRVDGDKVVPGGATDLVRFGFGYMMQFQGGQEVSEFVWEEMHAAGEKEKK